MVSPILSQPLLQPLPHLQLPLSQRMGALPESPVAGAGSFVGMLSSGVQAVNNAQLDANAQVHALLTGEDVTQAEVLSSVQKADMAFRLLIQVRNKLMSAFEELNSIRV
jgi:flagellar hook-basal body complex protein FliE